MPLGLSASILGSGGAGSGGGGSVIHNNTTSKQGGAAGEYYHLTLAELDKVQTSNTDIENASVFAQKQALAFNGTAGATLANVAAFGTGDFTFCATVNVDASATGTKKIWGTNGYNDLSYNATKGRIVFYDNVAERDGPLLAKGVTAAVSVRKSVGGLYIGVDGVEVNYPTSAPNMGVSLYIGAESGNALVFSGTISNIAIYNRALSAAEILALAETGVVPVTDNPGAVGQPAGVGLITGDNSTFASDTGFWTKIGTATISGGVANIGGVGNNINRNGMCNYGYKYRCTFTKGGTGTVQISDLSVSSYGPEITTAGEYTVEFTYIKTVSGTFAIAGVSGTSTVDNVTLIPLGAVCYPEPNALGYGGTWEDASGNNADITVPAGVSWLVPSSGVVRSSTLLVPSFTPASSSTAGTVGQITMDASYLYVWTGATTNKRIALTTY